MYKDDMHLHIWFAHPFLIRGTCRKVKDLKKCISQTVKYVGCMWREVATQISVMKNGRRQIMKYVDDDT